jgi:hypothetical protein
MPLNKTAVTCIAFTLAVALPWAVSATHRGQSLPSTSDLLGRVTDLEGCPIAGAIVSILNEDGNVVTTTTADDRGEYHLTGLRMTGRRASASFPGFGRVLLPRPLLRGSNRWDVGLPLAQEQGNMRISGVVQDESGKPLQDASVIVHSAFDVNRLVQLRSDKSGKFGADLYQLGQYVVYATQEGHVAAATSVNASLVSPPSLTLILKRRPCP